MTVVSSTDRPKSVRNRCVMEVFGGILCCPLVFEFSVGIGVLSKDWVRSPSFSLYVYVTYWCFQNFAGSHDKRYQFVVATYWKIYFLPFITARQKPMQMIKLAFLEIYIKIILHKWQLFKVFVHMSSQHQYWSPCWIAALGLYPILSWKHAKFITLNRM